MAKIQETQDSFERCHNPQDVPESLCVFCLHTIVAPNAEVLEQLEHQHICLEKQEPATRWGRTGRLLVRSLISQLLMVLGLRLL